MFPSMRLFPYDKIWPPPSRYIVEDSVAAANDHPAALHRLKGKAEPGSYGRELSSFGIRELVNIKSVWIHDDKAAQ